MPPLRQRTEEIPGMAEYFLPNLGYTDFPLDSEVLRLLTAYPWPGNTREFKNVLERALLLAQGEPLASLHFPDLSAELAHEDIQDLDSAEGTHILQVLHQFKGDKRKTCKALGLSNDQLDAVSRNLARMSDSQKEPLAK